MYKEGWCVGLGQEGVAWGRGNYLKYLKRWCNRKKGGVGNKDFKKGGKLDQGVSALKREGWNLLTNYGIEMKFGKILVQLITNISNFFSGFLWVLEFSQRPFVILKVGLQCNFKK